MVYEVLLKPKGDAPLGHLTHDEQVAVDKLLDALHLFIGDSMIPSTERIGGMELTIERVPSGNPGRNETLQEECAALGVPMPEIGPLPEAEEMGAGAIHPEHDWRELHTGEVWLRRCRICGRIETLAAVVIHGEEYYRWQGVDELFEDAGEEL